MKNIRIIVPIVLGLMLCSLILGCGSNATGGGGGGGGASTIYVSTTGHDDTGEGTADKPYRTIQKGLDNVPANGIVSVEAGIYTEHLQWPEKKNVTLRGESMSTTTLDASNTGRAIYISPISSTTKITSARIEKIDIKNGKWSGGSGAGIYFDYYNSKLELFEVCVRDCSIDAVSTAYGGGVSVTSGDHTAALNAVSCIIKNNSAVTTSGGAGGIYCLNARISSCEISNNYSATGIGGILFEDPGGRIENSIIHHNTAAAGAGGGIYSDSGQGYEIVNCTIASNEALGSGYNNGKGGGIYSPHSADRIVNCIFWGNTAETASNEVWVNYSAIPFTFSVTYSDIRGGYTGTGNTSDDPELASITDLHITLNTPSTVYRGGTLEGIPSVDYDGNTRPYSGHPGNCSMGAYED